LGVNWKEENNNEAAKGRMRKPGRRQSSPYILTIFVIRHSGSKHLLETRGIDCCLKEPIGLVWPQAALFCQCQCSLEKKENDIGDGRTTSFETVLEKSTGLDVKK